MAANEDVELTLKCYEINARASAARDLLLPSIIKIKKLHDLYNVSNRVKTRLGIQYKVLRERGNRTHGYNSEIYGPNDIPDAWGCRLITFFQSQVPEVVASILDILPHHPEISVEAINIFNNRPDNDKLSISPKVRAIVENYDAKYSKCTVSRIKLKVNSRQDGYSSVHIILSVPIVFSTNSSVSSNESVKIEIQIRDLFDEAWCQISHRLRYGVDKDMFPQTGEYPHPTIDELAGLNLNALKTVVDGCSQFADRIRHTYEEMRGRLEAVNPANLYVSVITLADVKNIVLEVIPVEKKELRRFIERGYDLQRDAGDAADENINKRAARNIYLAAAEEFKRALAEAGAVTELQVPNTDGRKIRWFLNIELANALIFSLPDTSDIRAKHELRERFEEAIAIYRQLEAAYPNDPIAYFREAAARRRMAETEEELTGLMSRLDRAKELLDSGQMRNGVDVKMTSYLIMIERALAKYACASMVDGDRRTELMRSALDDVNATVTQITAEQGKSLEIDRAYHRAVSNGLWFYSRLKHFGDNLTETDKIIIGDYISRLTVPEVWLRTQYYPTTIENLMYGYDVIGSREYAVAMAETNLKLLTEIAHDRRGLGEVGSPLEFLETDEKEIYQRAQDFFYTQRTPGANWKQ